MASMSFSVGADGSSASSLIERTEQRVKKVKKRIADEFKWPRNWWKIWLHALTTGFCAFVFFTSCTLVRGLYGDQWFGPVTIGGVFAAMTLLGSAFLGRGIIPVFDLTGVVINMGVFGIVARSADGDRSKDIRAKLKFVPALILGFTLIAAGFASAGISRAVLGESWYNGVAHIPTDPADFDNGKVFFIEFFVMIVYYIFIQQLTLSGVAAAHTAILSGFYMTGMQSLGYNISSACYNFVLWLTVNAVGFHANFWLGWWIYPVASLATVVGVLFINKIIFWLRNMAIASHFSKEARD